MKAGLRRQPSVKSSNECCGTALTLQKRWDETSFPRKQTKVHIQLISMIRQQIAILASYRLSESHGWPRDYDLWAIAKAVLPSQH